jgi:hypothetical protein
MGILSIRIFISLAAVSFFAPAAADSFDSDFEEKPWTEIEVQLPAFPQKEDLVGFKVGAANNTQFQLDSKSLSVGTDSVIRYTLIVVGPSGAVNISYEGMRCATVERRYYAFGHSDQTWSKARSNQWTRIQGTSNNLYVELYSNYFCTVGASAIRSADDILRVLRKGGNTRY